jgi:hypothetical protein
LNCEEGVSKGPSSTLLIPFDVLISNACCCYHAM